MPDFGRALLAIILFLLVALVFSEDRRKIPWRIVAGGLALQIGAALLFVFFPPATRLLLFAGRAAHALQTATDAGAGFVFGYLGGGVAPFETKSQGASFILAFRALPMVLTISALASLLFYWGLLQRICDGFAWLLRRAMGVSGPLAVGAAAHILVGMIEAPLLIRPYLPRMARGEIFALMSCGMAGVAGTVMAIYAGFLAPLLADAMGHILIGSVIATPAALAVAAIMSPWTPQSEAANVGLTLVDPPVGAFDALIRGVADGIAPVVGIVSVLLTTIALVTLVNMLLAHLPPIGDRHASLQMLFALPFRPVAWLMGVPWAETEVAAALMATKTVLNEFVAYRDLGALDAHALSTKSRLILTYALCGFANFGSMGILVGGLNAMLPARRAEIVALGMRSILSGTLATCMSATIAGFLFGLKGFA